MATVSESGFAGFSATSFWGFYAPAGTDRAIVGQFVEALRDVLREPDIAQRMRTALLLDPSLSGPAELRAFFRDQVRTWGQVIRENGLQRSQ